jgi:phenylpropionate dioxygenase-like ring-hydroxylating dioxygenase large terminal subunit
VRAEADKGLLHRLMDNVQRGRSDLAARAHACPVDHYFDPARYAEEERSLFRGYPILVAHSSQLAGPGDFVTHTSSGVPILVVRGKHGELNAFINVCRHRGAVVELRHAGRASGGFSCPYHAWRYGLDGRLVAVPAKASFGTLDEDRLGLIPLPVAERNGLVFVRPSPGAPIDLDRFLGAIGRELASRGLDEHVVFHSEEIPAKFNWKIGMDGALEVYHFGVVHRTSAAGLFASGAAAYDRFEDHARLAVPMRTLSAADGERDLRTGALLVYLLFPNTIVLFPPDHIILFSIFPTGAETCSAHFSILIPSAEATAERREHWERTTRLSRKVIEEDFVIGESIQRALRSGANSSVIYGGEEAGLADFHLACEQATQRSPWEFP